MRGVVFSAERAEKNGIERSVRGRMKYFMGGIRSIIKNRSVKMRAGIFVFLKMALFQKRKFFLRFSGFLFSKEFRLFKMKPLAMRETFFEKDYCEIVTSR